MTPNMVFERAISLMDELNEQTGSAFSGDTKEYEQRTLFILNTLGGELLPYSDTYKITVPGKRPIFKIVEGMDEEIELDNYLVGTVMPYGLAAHLLLNEDPTGASFFQQRYEELLRKANLGMGAASSDIIDVYGSGHIDEETGEWVDGGGDCLGYRWGGMWG